MIETLTELLKTTDAWVKLGTARMIFDEFSNEWVIYSKPYGKREKVYRRVDSGPYPKDALQDAIRFLIQASNE